MVCDLGIQRNFVLTRLVPCAAEEAQTVVKGMSESAIHSKYIELVCSTPRTLLCDVD
jgi:hypothetical protein